MIKIYKLIKVEMLEDNSIGESIIKESYSRREIKSFMRAVQKLNPHWELYLTVTTKYAGIVEGGLI